jgi:hypothetical protein
MVLDPLAVCWNAQWDSHITPPHREFSAPAIAEPIVAVDARFRLGKQRDGLFQPKVGAIHTMPPP